MKVSEVDRTIDILTRQICKISEDIAEARKECARYQARCRELERRIEGVLEALKPRSP